MVSYLTNFCKHGDPNGNGLTPWNAMTGSQDKLLRLGEKPTHMGKASMLKLVKTLLTNKAVGE
jgi:carboxylesterase type B